MADKAPDAAKAFDAYEVVGLIVPGTVLALLLTMEWPALRTILGDKGFGVGDLGLFILLAFVLGQLIQAVGNLIERVAWLAGGLPSAWVRSPRQTLVTSAQRGALETAVSVMEGQACEMARVQRSDWAAIVTRMYGRVRAAGLAGRVDGHNRTYGMCRGLASALFVALIWCVVAHPDAQATIAVLALSLAAALMRMRRAGVHYARALILEFIDLRPPALQG